MPILFQSQPGVVVQLKEPALQCTTNLLKLTPDITFNEQRSIVTRLTVGPRVNLQFLHSMGSSIYVYVFGDRIGEMTLSGLSFTCPCPVSTGFFGGSGAEGILSWYKENRASKKASPVQIVVGVHVLEGFVVGGSLDVVDPSLSLVQWGITMASLPEDD